MGLLRRIIGSAFPSKEKPLILSQISNLPRYYTINGIKYDIDNPKQIEKIPLFKDTFFIEGIEYGMDSILMEHGRKAYPNYLAVHQASIEKANEFRYNGIIFKTQKELQEDSEREERWRQQEIEKEKRKKQCNSFKISDMVQFEEIPFEWNWVKELSHTNGVAWFMLNMNNQYIALQYINALDRLIVDIHEIVPATNIFEIFANEIDFNYPIPLQKNSVPNTYVECVPYTKTGKISKYPVILHFASSVLENSGNYSYQSHPVMGEIKIMKDGNIGAAKVWFGHTIFDFGLNGISLMIKKISNNGVVIYKCE